MKDTDSPSVRSDEDPGAELATWDCSACARKVCGACGDVCELCADCAAVEITLDIESLGDGTQLSDPGNDPWPLRQQLMITPDGAVTWRSDVPGGGFACIDSIMLGWLPCNLTGDSLIRIAERLRTETRDELRRLLAGRDAPAGRESYGDALERVADRLDDAVECLAAYRVQAGDWFAERIAISEFLEHPSPAAWVEYQRTSADAELVDVAGWLDREIQARLAEATYNEALTAAGFDPEEDADTPEAIAALREWATRS